MGHELLRPPRAFPRLRFRRTQLDQSGLIDRWPTTGGNSRARRRSHSLFRIQPELAMEGVVRILSGCGIEVLGLEHSFGLLLDVADNFRKCDSIVIGRACGITSEVTDRLKVNRAYRRSKTNGRAQNIADLLTVDSRRQGGHDHHSQLGPAAVCNGFELDLKEWLSADCLVDVVADSVKLEKDTGQPAPFNSRA
jgi:hypothetical protein